MKIYCGPGCANCCLVISVWAIIQLGVMGYFFQQENIGLNHDFEKGKGSEVAKNCWVACAIYSITLLWSIFSVYMNNKDASNAKTTGYQMLASRSSDE